MRDVTVGDRVLIADGLVRAARGRSAARTVSAAASWRAARSRITGVNFPACRLSAASITAKDRADLAFGLAMGVD